MGKKKINPLWIIGAILLVLYIFNQPTKASLFSVVGTSQQCSSSPDFTFAISNGESFSKNAATYCSSGHGLWDVYTGVSTWTPYKEYKDSVSIGSCGATQCN